MNRAISDEIVDEIRTRCNIVDIIGSYIPVKKAGHGTWKALCPFHQEKTPSFNINEQRQHYHCFGCGKGGDVFNFVMEREGVDFPNAVHLLASRCSVVIPEKTYTNPDERRQAQERTNQRERIYAINEEFAVWYAAQLHEHPESPVAQYLLTRGIPDDIAAGFRIGAAPDSWDSSRNHGLSLGFSDAELLESGIITSNESSGKLYDRFRNRLIFPIWNEQGKVVAFSARTIEKNPEGAKYVNSPETPVFKKGNILYALPLARQEIQKLGFVILCEGQLDVIAMHRAGFCNAVAPQGTAFTDEQARILKRYTDKLYISFDSDSAGIKAAVRALEIVLPMDFEVKIIQFPAGRDPDEIFRDSGREGLKLMVDDAVDFFDFLCRQILSQFDQTTPFGKSRSVAETIPFIRKISQPVARDLYIQKLAAMLNVKPDTIYQELNKIRQNESSAFRSIVKPSADNAQPAADAPPGEQLIDQPADIIHAEETLLALALNFEDVCLRLSEELSTEMISRTSIGKALNELIKLTINGEWSSANASLSKINSESSDARLSMFLAAPEFSMDLIGSKQSMALTKDLSRKDANKNKAVSDNIATIKKYFCEKQRTELMSRLRSASTPEEKQELLKQLNAVIMPLSTHPPRKA
ncbi:MAG: DNA primase [Victivallaceae bacterium]|jgi:DNA primase